MPTEIADTEVIWREPKGGPGRIAKLNPYLAIVAGSVTTECPAGVTWIASKDDGKAHGLRLDEGESMPVVVKAIQAAADTIGRSVRTQMELDAKGNATEMKLAKLMSYQLVEKITRTRKPKDDAPVADVLKDETPEAPAPVAAKAKGGKAK